MQTRALFPVHRLLCRLVLLLVTLLVTGVLRASEPPIISFFNPSIGSVGTSVAITGENFIGVLAVKFNTTTVTNFNILGNQIAVNVPSGATTGPITVVTSGGSTTSSGLFLVQQSGIPEITGFSPTNGAPGTVVTVVGEHFAGVTEVRFNNIPATAFTLIGSQISVTVPNEAVSGSITVVSAEGSGVSTNIFEVVKIAPPTVGEFSPTSGPVGSLVTISGSNFTAVKSVQIGGIEANGFTVIGSQISASVPAGAKSGVIRVTTATGTGQSQGSFFVTDIPGPVIASFAPANGPGGTRVTVTGAFFNDTKSVSFNGKSANFLVFGNQIFTTVPDDATTGTITVVTAAGTAVSASSFTVTSSTKPKILSFSPTTGPVGTLITLKGENLFDVTSVKIGGVAASFNLLANPNITITVPEGAASGTITISAAGGIAVSDTPFTLSSAGQPIISSFSPESGQAGSLVIINGDNFQDASSVKIGTRETSFFVFGAQIFATLPADAITGFLSVTTPAGTGTSGRPFSIGAQTPTVLSFAPSKGSAGDVITIQGANLVGIGSVQIGGITVNVDSNNGSEIRFKIPANAVSGQLQLISTAGPLNAGGAVVITPKIDNFNPTSGSVGDVITLTGSGFDGVESVEINGLKTVFQRQSVNLVSVTIPDQGTSGSITIRTAAGAATSTARFNYIVKVPATPPTLALELLANGRVTLSWTNTNPAFLLQAAPELGGAWSLETTQPSVANGRRQVTVDPSTAPSRFFRLISPP